MFNVVAFPGEKRKRERQKRREERERKERGKPFFETSNPNLESSFESHAPSQMFHQIATPPHDCCFVSLFLPLEIEAQCMFWAWAIRASKSNHRRFRFQATRIRTSISVWFKFDNDIVSYLIVSISFGLNSTNFWLKLIYFQLIDQKKLTKRLKNGLKIEKVD